MSAPHATLTRPVINPDITDHFTDTPLPRAEAGHVLAYYLPLVAAESESESWQNQYLQARIHVGCAIGKMLGAQAFVEGAEVGAEIWSRRHGAGDASYRHWTMDQLHEELSTIIDQLLDGAP